MIKSSFNDAPWHCDTGYKANEFSLYEYILPSRRQTELKEVIKNYMPDMKTVHQARVLMVGPVGAGKSSFFNSINSAFRGNMTCQAIAGTSGTSVTTQVLVKLECVFY